MLYYVNYHNTGVVGGVGVDVGGGVGVGVGVVQYEEEERREGGAPYILKLCGSAVGIWLTLRQGAPSRHPRRHRPSGTRSSWTGLDHGGAHPRAVPG
jgi:hypothetical protein